VQRLTSSIVAWPSCRVPWSPAFTRQELWRGHLEDSRSGPVAPVGTEDSEVYSPGQLGEVYSPGQLS
jgi:hypothetical protein